MKLFYFVCMIGGFFGMIGGFIKADWFPFVFGLIGFTLSILGLKDIKKSNL